MFLFSSCSFHQYLVDVISSSMTVRVIISKNMLFKLYLLVEQKIEPKRHLKICCYEEV